ncbi:helix-turn-helix transcriptional regulator [Halorussus litoreus]|uniref:helix-turn-helix transcriptional regulator n=1 Tax=Halorussus litoreus TaxID=1710536 RepID=UPI0018E56343|nr:helix-turn-helix transcriptional regulator [Halorussus litoreus]
MSDEHSSTGREGVSTERGPAEYDRLAAEERPRTTEAVDALFEALADEHRRCVLAYLDDCDTGVAAFGDLVDHVAAEVETASAEAVEVRLHHAHLPKLEDGGLVEFDARSGHVRYRGDATVSDWLALAQDYATGASEDSN